MCPIKKIEISNILVSFDVTKKNPRSLGRVFSVAVFQQELSIFLAQVNKQDTYNWGSFEAGSSENKRWMPFFYSLLVHKYRPADPVVQDMKRSYVECDVTMPVGSSNGNSYRGQTSENYG